MTTTAYEASIPEAIKGIKVIDVDTHFTEPPDLWTSRAPAKYKDHVPYVKRTDGVDQWFFADKPMGPVSITVISKGHKKNYGIVTLDRYDEVDEATYDPAARTALMDEMGVWGQIVFPNAAGFSGNNFATLVPEDMRNLCVRMYNDAISDWQQASGNRLFPQALVPFWDIKEATREAQRIKEELGLTGIAAASAPETWGLPDYGDTAWDPFWEVCSELNIPINFHIGGGAVDGGMRWKSFGLNALEPGQFAAARGTRMMAPIAAGALMGALMNARVLINLIYSGMLDRWPKLKFVSIESGVGWIPFFLEMAEYQFEEMTSDDRWGLKLRPREYFQRHMYASWWFEDFGPRHALRTIGINNVLFETDFPHPTCLYPGTMKHLVDVLEDYTWEERKRILQDNAVELYNLPV